MLVKLLFDYTFILLNERRCEKHSFLSLFSPLLGGNSWSDSMRPSSLPACGTHKNIENHIL